jgi:O-antigen/teichoic acid export membrane protein
VSAAESHFRPGRLLGATTWRLCFLLLQGGSSVVVFTILSHILGRRELAATAVAQGVIVVAQAIGDFALSQAAVTVLPTWIAQDRGASAAVLSGAAAAYLGATVFAGLLTLLAVPIVPSAAAGPVAVSALAAAASAVVAGADGILRAQGEFRRPLVLMAVSEAGSFTGIPVAALTGSAVWTCAAIAAGMATGAAGAVLVLVRLRRAAPRADARRFVRASVPLGISQVFIALATRADTLLAGAVAGLVAAGTFEGSWRIYQLTQYVAGGISSAAAPFIADAIGAGRTADALVLLRRLIVIIGGLGVVAAVGLYLLRSPIASLFVGSLGSNVARCIAALAFVSPLTALGFVLLAFGAGAGVNLPLAAALGHSEGARGVVLGCVAGQAVTSLLLLARFVPFVRQLRRPPSDSSQSGLAPEVAR